MLLSFDQYEITRRCLSDRRRMLTPCMMQGKARFAWRWLQRTERLRVLVS